jgi:hypothetical protein
VITHHLAKIDRDRLAGAIVSTNEFRVCRPPVVPSCWHRILEHSLNLFRCIMPPELALLIDVRERRSAAQVTTVGLARNAGNAYTEPYGFATRAAAGFRRLHFGRDMLVSISRKRSKPVRRDEAHELPINELAALPR